MTTQLTVPHPSLHRLLLSSDKHVAVVVTKLCRTCSVRLGLGYNRILTLNIGSTRAVTGAHDAGVYLLCVGEGGEGEDDDGQAGAREEHVV